MYRVLLLKEEIEFKDLRGLKVATIGILIVIAGAGADPFLIFLVSPFGLMKTQDIKILHQSKRELKI